ARHQDRSAGAWRLRDSSRRSRSEVVNVSTQPQIAAQVVLTPSSLLSADWVVGQFAIAGFQTGPVVGISFSIGGSVEQFEQFFKIRSERTGPQPFATDELPLDALPPAVRQHVQAVLFTRPPDFGPTSFA